MTFTAYAVPWDRVLADAVFDSGAHSRFGWEELGIRSTVIPVNARGQAGPPGVATGAR
jgi:hypothetical protein